MASTITQRLHITDPADGREFILTRSNRPGYWRIETVDREGLWVGSIWTDRPLWSGSILDVEAARKYPQFADIILSNLS